MSNVIPFRHSSDRIRQVRTGVFLLEKPPVEALLATNNYFNADAFGDAGERAGKTANYGQGVMRDIALQMVGIEAENLYSVDGNDGYLLQGTPEHELYYEIYRLMNNPDTIRQGSRDRLLLGRQLVHDVWALGRGSELVAPESTPRLGKVGQRVVSMLFETP